MKTLNLTIITCLKLSIEYSDMNSRAWKVYEYLKENCVGYENRKKAREIVSELNELGGVFENYRQEWFRADIVKIKRNSNINRIISSNHYGYWLSVESDEYDGLSYQKKKIKSEIENAINNGIPIEFFYNVLNEIKDVSKSKKNINNQKRLVFAHEKDEFIKKSDDLM